LRKLKSKLQGAIRAADLLSVRLLVEGGASIPGTKWNLNLSTLNLAAYHGGLLIVKWLLAESGANVFDVADKGFNVLLSAARYSRPENAAAVQWLLEHGASGADIMDMSSYGWTIWDLLLVTLAKCAHREEAAGAHLTALLRVTILQCGPPADQVMKMSPQHSRVVEEGARLRAGLPAYLARRRAQLAEHTSLIALLLTLVSSYDHRGALGHGARRTSATKAAHVRPGPRPTPKGSDGIVASVLSITDLRFFYGNITELIFPCYRTRCLN
jgi:hypothetical protein